MIVTKGQVAVDTAAASACQAMIKTFFNVGTEDSNRLPTPEQRDEFLEANFYLARTSFADTLDGIDDNSAINEPALVDELLRQENGGSIVGSQEDQIHGDFQNDILGGTSEVANWVTLALQVFERRRADVIAPIIARSETGLAGRHVTMARQRLAMRLKGGGDDGIRAALFRYLDNRARGGLDYTIRLVEDSKLRIDEDVAWLEEARAKYDERAEAVRARFNLSLENLRMAAQARWLRGPDRAAAELYLNHLRDETAFYVKLLLRRQACIEGITFLHDMSTYLGTQRGVDASGRIIWDGAVAELVNGRNLVEQLLHELDAEVRLLQDAVSRQNAGTYVVLADADSEAETVMATSAAEVQQWATEIFDSEGGSRTLFPVLEDDKKRAQLLGKLRGLAREKLAPRASRLRSVTDLLGALPERQRIAVFDRAMRRAMPWVNASFDRTGGRLPMPDRFKLIVAVEDLAGFQRFSRELRETIPLPFNHFDLVPSGLRDRVVVYCELSGIPLDTIISLGDEWRNAYRSERRGALPLHNHNSATRFANPVVPTNDEIEKIRSCMKVFLRAVCFGILERESGREAGYQFHLDGGDLMDVGTERHIRADGFLAIHFEEITRTLEQFERSLTPIQVLAASVLLEWTSRFAYAPRMVRRDNRSAPFPGLTNLVAAELASLYFNRFRQMDGAERIARPEEVRDRLRDLIPQWTAEIEGSVDDLDPMDASYRQPDPTNPIEQEAPRSVNKRRILRDRFTAEGLERLLAPSSKLPTPPPPPPQGTGRWFVSVNRKVTGPFTANELLMQHFARTFLPTTNVLPEGAMKWLKAQDDPELRRVCETELPGEEHPEDPLANPPPD
jgi:hypothetical protein